MSEVNDAERPGNRLGELSPLQKAALAIKELRARLDAVESAQREPMAIVGMSCRFPQASNLDEYWQLLSSGVDAISEVPAERWDLEHYYDPNPNAPGKINTRYGGFLNRVDGFDAAFFGISPREAELLDPQQRMLLEQTWHALEDAGQSPAALRGSRTGVFVGITQGDYGMMQMGGAVEEIQAYSGTGNGFCFAAGRIAYILGLIGPTWAVDTACSSSLVALHSACTALRNRECDVAIVAGAQLNLTPPMQVFLTKTQSFSPDGRCRTFDETAGGFVLGEGVGVLVLRRQSDAVARHDRIRALIRASGVNHDGPASGLTVPNEASQEGLIREVMAKARLTPADIDYIETHGSATDLGDSIEVGALRSVFRGRDPQRPLIIGSVKTNFGHLSAAAGIAGLIKVVLMLEHQQVAPHLHFKNPSPRISWDGFAVKVPTALLPWQDGAGDKPRYAGISSFGLSGTNVHAIIEEAPAAVHRVPTAHDADRPRHLLALSARTPEALRTLAERYRDLPAEWSVADIAYSANTGRSPLSQRLALVAGSRAELRARLDAYLRGDDTAGVWSGAVPKGGAGRLALVFGADLAAAALQQLAHTQPVVAAALAEAEALAQTHLGTTLSGAAAVFAGQMALVQLWRSWGVRPAAVAGYGIGCLTAAWAAGAVDLEQAIRWLAKQPVTAKAPEIPVYSALSGQLLAPAAVLDLDLQAGTVSAVAATALCDAGYRTLLGVADSAALAALQPTTADAVWLPLTAGQNYWDSLLDALAQLYLRGHNLDWDGFDAGYVRQRVDLPGYPFQHKRFWVGGVAKAVSPAAAIAAPVAPVVTTAAPDVAEVPVAAVAATEIEPAITAPLPTEATLPAMDSDLARLLGNQLEAAAAAVNDVVAQQLQFLMGRMAAGYEPEAPVTAPEAAPAATPQEAAPVEAPTPVETVVAANTPTAAVAEPAPTSPDTLGDWHLLRLAAADEAALEQTSNGWVSSGLIAGTGSGPARRILVHRGREDAVEALQKPDTKRVLTAKLAAERALVLMFPGVGDHYLHMGQGLYASEPVFRREIDRCCTYLQPLLGVDLREVLYPPKPAPAAEAAPAPKMDLRAMLGRGPATVDPAEARLNKTIHSQPLVFIIEYALGCLWLARGLQPRAMIGYSIGEYTAACLAGVVAVEDVLRLITRRAQLIQELPEGVMLAVPLAEERLKPLLGSDLSLCIVSTPAQCVVGGTEAAVAALEARLKQDEIVSRRVPSTHAFHSHMLQPLHNALVELIGSFKLNPPRLPYLSNLTGDWIRDDQATDPAYWARHTYQTVRFADGLGRLLDSEGQVFLEVGPGQSLSSFVLQHPAAQKIRDKVVLPSLRNRYEKQDDEAFILTTLGKLWLSGVGG